MIDILKSGNIWAGFIKYYYIFEVSFKNSIIYLWDVLFGNAFLIIIVFIMSQIWFAAYSYNGKPTIEGFTIYQMVWYIFVSIILSDLKMLLKDYPLSDLHGVQVAISFRFLKSPMRLMLTIFQCLTYNKLLYFVSINHRLIQ